MIIPRRCALPVDCIFAHEKHFRIERIAPLMTGPETPSANALNWEVLRQRLHAATEALCRDGAQVDEEAILAERARQLAAATDQEERSTDSFEVIVFSISGERYALEARIVLGVISQPELTPVPNTPDFLIGIHNLRGEVLAVMDLRSFLNVPLTTSLDRWLIVVGEDSAEFGIMADEVSEVSDLPRESVLRPSPAGQAGGTFGIRGITADAIVLLDSELLMNDTRLWVDTKQQS